jgi:hypothetical protein
MCVTIIIDDELRCPQRPITALYFGSPSLRSYFNLGLKMTVGNEMRHPLSEQSSARAPSWAEVTLATTHCGAGCALGDIVSEWSSQWD